MAKEDTKVIENFILKDKGGRGDRLIADKRRGTLISMDHVKLPLAVRLADGGLLANGDPHGAAARWQPFLLETLKTSPLQFAMIPFDSIAAAWTNGRHRDWRSAPLTAGDLRKEVEIVIPSTSEGYREVPIKDQYGHQEKREIYIVGNSVIRVHDHFYLSGTDETASTPYGEYFMAKLVTDRPPQSYEEAMSLLKPEVVREAETRGANVRRQGEWFAVPTMRTTSQLLADVERGLAVLHEKHTLGRGGHHRLEEAVIYRGGPEKGNVYARGTFVHLASEHLPLDLGFRWHQIVHNIQGASYTLAGNSD